MDPTGTDIARISAGDASDDEWDRFLAAHPDGHHEQSSAHARQRAAAGFRADRVVLWEGGRVVGGFQALARRSPVGTLAVVRRAPLAEGDRPELLERLASELERLARRRSFVAVRVDTFPTQVAANSALERVGYRFTEQWHGNHDTRLLPLALDDEQLLARMKPKGRAAARGARRAGVTVTVGGEQGLADFFELYRMTASYHGFPHFPLAYFQSLWRLFGPVHRAQHFVAYQGGKAVAAICNCVAGGRLYYGWTGTARDPEHRKLKANFLLQLEAMIWGRDHGYTLYDLGGTAQFKDQLGGDQVVEPLPLRKSYGRLRRLRDGLADLSWSIPTLRRGVEIVAHRLYKPLPF
jgi:lipid II:glycine glycyltransferase (peptidoglycan interpeptide bridge formation enzyme)